jgi:hypothetical protein
MFTIIPRKGVQSQGGTTEDERLAGGTAELRLDITQFKQAMKEHIHDTRIEQDRKGTEQRRPRNTDIVHQRYSSRRRPDTGGHLECD